MIEAFGRGGLLGEGASGRRRWGVGVGVLSRSLVFSAVSVPHTRGQGGRYLPLLVFLRLPGVLAAVKIQQS